MKIIKKMGKFIVNLFFAFIFVAVLCLGAGFAFGYRPYVVLSGSMEPTIPTGSLAFVDTHAEYQDVRTDDIIAFRAGNALVTHRAVHIDTHGITTKGDANDESDGSPVTEKNFYGQTKFHIPKFGLFIKWAQGTQGKIILVTLLMAAVLFRVILNSMHE